MALIKGICSVFYHPTQGFNNYCYICAGQVLHDQLLPYFPRPGTEQGRVVERCDVSSLPYFFWAFLFNIPPFL